MLTPPTHTHKCANFPMLTGTTHADTCKQIVEPIKPLFTIKIVWASHGLRSEKLWTPSFIAEATESTQINDTISKSSLISKFT